MFIFSEEGELLSLNWDVPRAQGSDDDVSFVHNQPSKVIYTGASVDVEYQVKSKRGRIVLHREKGKPARLRYSSHDNSIEEAFFNMGKLHSLTGPAIVKYSSTTFNKFEEKYYFDNIQLNSKSEWIEKVKEYYREFKNNSKGTITTDISF